MGLLFNFKRMLASLASPHSDNHLTILSDDAKYRLYAVCYRYPNIGELAYGSDRRGCFEIPDNVKEPTSDIDVPDILPIECDDERGDLHDPLAMMNPSQLVSNQLNMEYSRIVHFRIF